MPSAKTVKAGQGLSALAKQDYLARVRRETTARFAAIMSNVKGKAGTVKRATLEAVKMNKGNPLDFSVAVIKLHGYEVQIDGDNVRYAQRREVVIEQPQAKPEINLEPMIKSDAA